MTTGGNKKNSGVGVAGIAEDAGKGGAAAIVIAIDGPVASGKGTLARRLADHFDFAYLDTGSLYRTVAARLLEAGRSPTDTQQAVAVAETLVPAQLDRPDLRLEAVGRAASEVAAMAGVRQALLAFQRRFAAIPPDGRNGAVLDGRDIGTIVCPDATVKLFITASAEIRAERRWKELQQRGEPVIKAGVLADLRARDDRDAQRSTAPLVQAEDAFLLDTSALDADAVFRAALDLTTRRLGERATDRS